VFFCGPSSCVSVGVAGVSGGQATQCVWLWLWLEYAHTAHIHGTITPTAAAIICRLPVSFLLSSTDHTEGAKINVIYFVLQPALACTKGLTIISRTGAAISRAVVVVRYKSRPYYEHILEVRVQNVTQLCGRADFMSFYLESCLWPDANSRWIRQRNSIKFCSNLGKV
jgi:hypothetical protein